MGTQDAAKEEEEEEEERKAVREVSGGLPPPFLIFGHGEKARTARTGVLQLDARDSLREAPSHHFSYAFGPMHLHVLCV
jgi:hypothetical protein